MSIQTHFRLPHTYLIASVTQIPLESPRPDASAKPRPPWIRPVRKKTLRSSASNESTSQHSSPEAFSPTDAFLDLSGASAKMTSPPASSPFTNGAAKSAYGQGSTPGPSTFMDTNAMDISSEPNIAMNPSDLLAMFSVNDGSGIDVAQLLMSPSMEGQGLSDGPQNFFNMGVGRSNNGIVSSSP